MFSKLILAPLVLSLLLPVVASADEVNLYSARKEKLIKPLLDRFTQETGIEVNLVTGKADALLQRLQSEGRNTPADLLITTDAGRLHRAKAAGVTQTVDSELLNKVVPSNYRDPQGHWFGLSLRARPILYVKGKVDPATLSSYEALTDPQWKGRICIRSSGNIYNQSLVASMIEANGLESTEAWAKSFVKQFARPPKGGDRDQIKAAAAGLCDIAVANTYYLAGMLKSKDQAQRQAAEKMGVFWPNQAGRGAHVNISGAALIKTAKHKQAAIKLLEFLVGESAQAWYAETNGEYPVRSNVAAGETLQAWGKFSMDGLNLSRLGELNPEALKLMDRAGWK
ncbi:MAG: Fe(3+) ABC transporter substrate-binding protein [Candidatus Thiodiazotropha lotti]|nr:Fe(3+) ABC transporter substrate-binding protein [Candidatus Thiodiazotropha lotti]MCW4222791.1 Fe(3+) ABC transporter substrate-binding protein [Candidatus Thiodiazotropha lotti]